MARVLIADDASFMRQMIREIIEPEGHQVVGEATNGIEAVELYREFSPDLVTMDIVMPKRSGIDAVKDAEVHFERTYGETGQSSSIQPTLENLDAAKSEFRLVMLRTLAAGLEAESRPDH